MSRHARILTLIATHGPAMPRELARRLNEPAQLISAACCWMRKAGYVRRVRWVRVQGGQSVVYGLPAAKDAARSTGIERAADPNPPTKEKKCKGQRTS